MDTRVPRDTVQRCVQETLVLLSYTLAKKQDVDFVFKDLGCLRFRKSRVKMQFSADFVSTLDSTGRLLHSLLSVSVSLGRHCHGFLGDALKGRWQWLLLVGLTRLVLETAASCPCTKPGRVIARVQALAVQLLLLVKRA